MKKGRLNFLLLKNGRLVNFKMIKRSVLISVSFAIIFFVAGLGIGVFFRVPPKMIGIKFIEGTKFVDDFEISEFEGRLHYNGNLFTGVSVLSGSDYNLYAWIEEGLRNGPNIQLDSNQNLMSVSTFYKGFPFGSEIMFSGSYISKLSIIGSLVDSNSERVQYWNGYAIEKNIEDEDGLERAVSVRELLYIEPFDESL